MAEVQCQQIIPEGMSKILIAYYSRRGQNYVDGVIRDLETGNTEFLARRLAKMTDGTLFRIDTVKPYPAASSTT